MLFYKIERELVYEGHQYFYNVNYKLFEHLIKLPKTS